MSMPAVLVAGLLMYVKIRHELVPARMEQNASPAPVLPAFCGGGCSSAPRTRSPAPMPRLVTDAMGIVARVGEMKTEAPGMLFQPAKFPRPRKLFVETGIVRRADSLGMDHDEVSGGIRTWSSPRHPTLTQGRRKPCARVPPAPRWRMGPSTAGSGQALRRPADAAARLPSPSYTSGSSAGEAFADFN